METSGSIKLLVTNRLKMFWPEKALDVCIRAEIVAAICVVATLTEYFSQTGKHYPITWSML